MNTIDCLVVFESLFGNARLIAQQVGSGLATCPGVRVTLQRAGVAKPDSLAAADLLVIGVPTHVFGQPSPWSRAWARRFETATDAGAGGRLEPDAAGPGVRELVAAMGAAPPGGRAAVFDTRLASPIAGSAARPVGRTLHRLGWLVSKPQHFIVTDMTGPLRDGELERARKWGASLLNSR